MREALLVTGGACGLPVAAMNPSTDSESPSAAAPSADDTQAVEAPRGLLESVRALWDELPGLLSDRLDLLVLELKRAGDALVQIVVLLIAVAVLGVTALLALWAGIALGLVEQGLHWSLALLVVVVLNAVVAFWGWWRLRRLLPLLFLPATCRHLSPRAVGPLSDPPVHAGDAAAATPTPGAGPVNEHR